MNGINKTLVCVCCFAGVYFSGCTMAPSEYATYYSMHKKRYTATIKRNDITAQVRYLPDELFVAKILQSDTTQKIENVKALFSNSLFINVSMTYDSTKTASQYTTVPDAEGSAYMYTKSDTVYAVAMRPELTVDPSTREYVLTFPVKSFKKNISNYTIKIRDLDARLGTIEVSMNSIYKKSPELRN